MLARCRMASRTGKDFRHDTGSTTARSVDEVALIRDTVSHYAPVLIAQNSPRRRPWRARIFSIGEGCQGSPYLVSDEEAAEATRPAVPCSRRFQMPG